MASAVQTSESVSSVALCIFYGAGIIGMLVVYGLLQERIMSQPYGETYFTFSVFLVFFNRLVAISFAVVMILVQGEEFRNAAPMWKYFAISFSNVAASTCQYDALMYVSFPVQMLGKSFKMMPVMIWGMVIAGKQYSLSDWLLASAVTAGVTQFLVTGNIASSHSTGSTTYGLGLLVGFLALDGFTSAFQERLFRQHTTSKYNQMLYINLGSATVSLLTLALSGTVVPSLQFCADHPELARDAVYLSAAAVGGQWFIYSQVKDFGALVFAATMNVRQVVSILFSYVAYSHKITQMQFMGLTLVFVSLFYKSTVGLIMSGSNEERTPLKQKKTTVP